MSMEMKLHQPAIVEAIRKHLAGEGISANVLEVTFSKTRVGGPDGKGGLTADVTFGEPNRKVTSGTEAVYDCSKDVLIQEKAEEGEYSPSIEEDEEPNPFSTE